MNISPLFTVTYKGESNSAFNPQEAVKPIIEKLRQEKLTKDKCLMHYEITDLDNNIKVVYPVVEIEIEDLAPSTETK